MSSVVLSGLCYVTCLVYLDDIVVGRDTTAELAKNVKQVLMKLILHNLRINAEKCSWGLEEIGS